MMPGKDEWQTVISKKTMKMIKQLEGVPGIKWKSSTEPVLELKENPNSGASTSRSLTWRRFKTKRFYKTSSKKSGSSNKHSKLKEKRTVLQKIINNLEDYRQPVRRPITLADFMSELQIDPSEVEEDEQDDEELLHVETCRVISVTSTVCQRDSIKDHDRGQIVISPIKMTNKMTSESCLMVLQTDDNSEEELCFPSDDESDQRIVSQMERVKLNEDSEHTTKTSLDEAESNEVDQVQLRSVKPTKSSEAKASTSRSIKQPKEVQEKQTGRKSGTLYLPKKSNTLSKSNKVVLHLGSDTEEDDDISETYKPLIKEKQKENTFVVTLIPPQHFREMVSREVHNVEELKIFYVPPLRGSSGPGSLFYKSGEYEEENIDELRNFNEDAEILPTEMLRYCPKRIQQMIRKAGVHNMGGTQNQRKGRRIRKKPRSLTEVLVRFAAPSKPESASAPHPAGDSSTRLHFHRQPDRRRPAHTLVAVSDRTEVAPTSTRLASTSDRLQPPASDHRWPTLSAYTRRTIPARAPTNMIKLQTQVSENATQGQMFTNITKAALRSNKKAVPNKALISEPGNGKAPRRDVMFLGGPILAVHVLYAAGDGRFRIHHICACALLYQDLSVPRLPLTRRDTPHHSGLPLRRRSSLRTIETALIYALLHNKCEQKIAENIIKSLLLR
ncbi:hypothetical protein M5K25_025931 [Dendrobium thyrsiflorum]|uniref:Uncharacterized protein n=1 Tax=Dendrobium thyrsiflorum TaxID=117978 RepID=A0ABD0TW14_DENTH